LSREKRKKIFLFKFQTILLSGSKQALLTQGIDVGVDNLQHFVDGGEVGCHFVFGVEVT
jgi:hypothetical protein